FDDDRRRSGREIHYGELRRRLLRVAGYGDRATSPDFAVRRNVRAAADPAARRAVAAEYSHQGGIQAGQVFNGSESVPCTRPSRLLGRSGLLVVLRVVRNRRGAR